MTLTGQVTGQVTGPGTKGNSAAPGAHHDALTGPGPDSLTWLTVTEVMARTGLGERSVRRMIAKERVVSRVDEEGRRVILESSLPGQSQGAGQGAGHGMSHGFGHDLGQGAGHDSGRDPGHGPSHDWSHDRAMIEFLQGQLQQARDSERELRLLLAQAVKTNQLLAEPRMLPPAPDTGPEEPGAHTVGGRTRWWNLFWR
jgi:hypothetical protein